MTSTSSSPWAARSPSVCLLTLGSGGFSSLDRRLRSLSASNLSAPETSTAADLKNSVLAAVCARQRGLACERISPYDIAPLPRWVHLEWGDSSDRFCDANYCHPVCLRGRYTCMNCPQTATEDSLGWSFMATTQTCTVEVPEYHVKHMQP